MRVVNSTIRIELSLALLLLLVLSFSFHVEIFRQDQSEPSQISKFVLVGVRRATLYKQLTTNHIESIVANAHFCLNI